VKKKLPLLFLAVMIALNCSAPDKNVKQLPKRGICAHRGAMETHPENTLAAFKEAIRLGAHMIEFDVRLTKDGKLVILHDKTVDRTSNGTGPVSDLTFEQVRKLDVGSWKDKKFVGEKIPTLDEALAVMPDNIWLNAHLKGDWELGNKVAAAIVENNRQDQTFLACGFEAAEGAKCVSPKIKIGNMERQTENADYVAQTIERKAAFIQFYKTAIDDDLKGYIAKLKEGHVLINYFHAETAETQAQLFDLGVDFVLVNHLAAAMKTADSLGIAPVKQAF